MINSRLIGKRLTDEINAEIIKIFKQVKEENLNENLIQYKHIISEYLDNKLTIKNKEINFQFTTSQQDNEIIIHPNNLFTYVALLGIDELPLFIDENCNNYESKNATYFREGNNYYVKPHTPVESIKIDFTINKNNQIVFK